MYNSFATWLKGVMKKEHVSGQAIADQVGVSQKSISRYSTGEVDPDELTKNKIYKAITVLTGNSGYAEENSLPLQSRKREQLSSIEVMDEPVAQKQEGGEGEQTLFEKWTLAKNEAVFLFAHLTEANQRFVVENLDVLLSVELYETYLVDYFTEISDKAREQLMEDLRTAQVLLPDLQKNRHRSEKIASYFRMIHESAKIQPGKAADPQKSFENEWTKEFCRRLEERISLTNHPDEDNGISVELLADCLEEYMRYTPEIWYFLLLVQMNSLNDRERIRILYSKKYGSIGKMEFVGTKTLSLIFYLRSLAGKETPIIEL